MRPTWFFLESIFLLATAWRVGLLFQTPGFRVSFTLDGRRWSEKAGRSFDGSRWGANIGKAGSKQTEPIQSSLLLTTNIDGSVIWSPRKAVLKYRALNYQVSIQTDPVVQRNNLTSLEHSLFKVINKGRTLFIILRSRGKPVNSLILYRVCNSTRHHYPSPDTCTTASFNIPASVPTAIHKPILQMCLVHCIKMHIV